MMDIEQSLEQIAQMRYPRQVDVVDRVMAQVSAMPPLHRHQSLPLWQRIGAVAAAAVAVLFVVNLSAPYLRSYDEEGLVHMMVQYNDYSAWNTVEQAAVNPYEYLYEE